MGILSLYHNKISSTENTEQKTFFPAPQSGFQTATQYFQQAFSRLNIGIESYFTFYQQIMPLQDAVNKIGEKLASIEIFLKSPTGEIVTNHPFLDLLKRPNFEQCQSDFMEALSKDFSISANAYIMITLSTQNIPLELFIVPPQNIQPELDNRGFIRAYRSIFFTETNRFDRVEINGEVQYLAPDRSARLLHIKGYNPNGFARRQFGLSKMHGILYELMLYRAGALHNYSLLDQGGRPSMWIKPTNRVTTKDALERLEAEISNLTAGAGNAGRIITSNDIEAIQQLMVSNIDMDYSILESKNYNKIYQTYHVPLPLITNEASTFSNYETAQSAMIKEGVLPDFKRFTNYFTRYLLPYFDTTDFTVTFLKGTIDALRAETIEELKSSQPLGIQSDNEMRQQLSLPLSTDPEADLIWKSTQLIESYPPVP